MAKKSIIDLQQFEANAQAAYASQLLARQSSSSSSTDEEPGIVTQQHNHTDAQLHNSDGAMRAVEEGVEGRSWGAAIESQHTETHLPARESGEEPNDGGAIQGDVESEATAPTPVFVTKKATTIMPKEVFNKLQMYCTNTDTPKHRALYLFILDGLLKAESITEEEYKRFKDMAALLITTVVK